MRAMSMRESPKAVPRTRKPVSPRSRRSAARRFPEASSLRRAQWRSDSHRLGLEAAEVAQNARRAIRFARLADIAAMQNEPVMRMLLIDIGHGFLEPALNLKNIF